MARGCGNSVLLLAGFALAHCLILSCPRAHGQSDNGTIAGQITVARGNFPSQSIQVTLQSRGATLNDVWTDAEGKFTFHQLPANLYHVIVNDENFEPYQEEVKVDPHLTPVNILTIRLTPKARQPNSSPPPPGGSRYLVDRAEYEKRFSDKARKEFHRGVKSQAKGKIEEAIRHFQVALKEAPDFYPAHNDLGTAYLAQSKFTEAEREFRTVLNLNHSDTEAYFNLANVFLLTTRYDDAREMVAEGLRRQPKSGLGQFLLGSICARQGQLLDAETALHQAIRLDSGLARAHLELVNVYLRQKRKQDAIRELKLFLDRFSEDPLAAQARSVLDRLEGGS